MPSLRLFLRPFCISMLVLAAGAPAAQAQQPGDPLPGLSSGERQLFNQGKELFERGWLREEGLGPYFNNRSCAACHRHPTSGGFGASYNAHLRLGEIGLDGVFRTLPGHRSGVLQENALVNVPVKPIPPEANTFSIRQVPSLFGLGLVEAIPDDQILARADWVDRDGDGISGRVPGDARGIVRRFGTQSQTGSLLEFVRDAFAAEIGMKTEELPNLTEEFIYVFLSYLAPVGRGSIDDDVRAGEEIFASIGCADCHTPSFELPDAPFTTADGLVVDAPALQGKTIWPWSDFLLHDMGPALDDGVALRNADSSEYRTTPLWGLRLRGTYLHDGRARDLGTALLLHGGEASAARHRSRSLDTVQRRQLFAFLRSL